MNFSVSPHIEMDYYLDEELLEFLGEEEENNSKHDDSYDNDRDDVMGESDSRLDQEFLEDEERTVAHDSYGMTYETDVQLEHPTPEELQMEDEIRPKPLDKIIFEQDDGNMLNEIKQEMIHEEKLVELCQQHAELSEQYFHDIVDIDNALSVKSEIHEEMKTTIEEIIDISSELSTNDEISACLLVNPSTKGSFSFTFIDLLCNFYLSVKMIGLRRLC